MSGFCEIGFHNQATGNHTFIGGGSNSQVIAAFGVIGGGEGNKVTVQGNAILGGVNNSDNSLNGVMIAGNGITAAIPDALHINGLWANGIPGPIFGGAGLPVGTVYWDNVTVPGYGTAQFLMLR